MKLYVSWVTIDEVKDKMDNMQKGRISEKIVEKMFKEAGFKVVKAGYENTFKGLADRENLLQGPAAKYIRHHPDLIVVDKFNYAYLIEVKFRTFGVIDQKDLFNYPETQVILLTKDSMHCQYLKEIHKNGKKFVPFGNMKPFSQIPEDILRKYTLKLRRVLGDENIFGQVIEGISQKIVGKEFIQKRTPGDVKFSYIEDYNKKGDTYEYSDNTETITSKKFRISSSRDGMKWNDGEINLLKGYYRSKYSISDIATNLGREKDAVIFRLARIGLITTSEADRMLRGVSSSRRPKHHRENQHKRNYGKRNSRGSKSREIRVKMKGMRTRYIKRR
jgi:hypothetical protein